MTGIENLPLFVLTALPVSYNDLTLPTTLRVYYDSGRVTNLKNTTL